MDRKALWKPLAIVTSTTTVLLFLLLLPACCCLHRGPGSPIAAAPPIHVSPLGGADIPIPTEAAAKAPTDTEMRNVLFHADETTVLDIHLMRGTLESKEAGTPVNLDNKTTFVMKIDIAEIGMDSASLDNLINRYAFGYPGAPLREVHVSMEGTQLRQEGIIHKIVDIPFTMWADVSASGNRIRIHPTKIDICGINGMGLLKAVGQSLEKMLALPKERGVSAEGNDLLLDPLKILPPPRVELQLVAVKVVGRELVLVCDAGQHLPALSPTRPGEKNWMYFHGGTLRIGKLLMVDADMQVVDSDPADPFDFFIDRYNEQLVEGYTRNQVNYGLVVYMRDFADVGKPKREGERLAPVKSEE
ncbi:MAG: hypothetical protein ABI837_04235 [Acidobacteriota bacterium]